MSAHTTRILVSEVGPRDGLQSIDSIMPTKAKKAWIAAEAEAGVREIEVGSFVPPKLLPQLADTAEIVRYARTLPGLTVAALVPNLRGAQDAVAAGAHKITLPLSVSETHSKANLRKTHAEVLEEVRAEVGDDALTGVHLHNTRGLGLANALAALDAGITTLDASLGGIGGCPFAPGASGNIVTEDLVFMLDSMGCDTGIDVEKLLRVRDIVRDALPDEELYGFTPDAGLPKGYRGPWGLPSAA